MTKRVSNKKMMDLATRVLSVLNETSPQVGCAVLSYVVARVGEALEYPTTADFLREMLRVEERGAARTGLSR